MSKKKNAQKNGEEEEEREEITLSDLKHFIENTIRTNDAKFDNFLQIFKEENEKINTKIEEQQLNIEYILQKIDSRNNTPTKQRSSISNLNFNNNNTSIENTTTLTTTITPTPTVTSLQNQREMQNSPILSTNGNENSSILLNFQTTPKFDNIQAELRAANIKKRNSSLGDLYNFTPMISSNKLVLKSDQHFKIVWNKRNIDDFLIFIDKVLNYQKTQSELVPNIFSHIDESIQARIGDILTRYNPTKFSKSIKWSDATIQDITEAAQIFFAPKTLDEFNTKLLKSCERYKVIQRSFSYEDTYIHLKNLKNKFMDRYDLLTDGARLTNRTSVIPANNFKQGGLLHIWMQLTPEGARDSFTNILINEKYSSLEDFLMKFFVIVEETYVMSQWVYTYKNRIGFFNKNRSDQLQFIGDDSQDEDSTMSEPEADTYSQEADDEEDYLNYVHDKSYNMKDKNRDRKQHYDKYKQRDNFKYKDNNQKYNFIETHRKNNFKDHKSNDTKDKGRESYQQYICHNLLINGKCDSKSCKFSHDQILLKQEQDKLTRKWNIKKRAKEPENDITKYKPDFIKSQINNLEDSRSDSDNNIDITAQLHSHSSEEESINLISSLLTIHSSSKYWKATHREAFIKPYLAETFENNTIVLFDSGANGKNYITKSLIDKNGWNNFTTRCEHSCTIASGERIIIDRKIKLTIMFRLSLNRRLEKDLEFLIFEGLQKEIILGMTDIMDHFRELYIEMLTNNQEDQQINQIEDVQYIKIIDQPHRTMEPWSSPALNCPEDDFIQFQNTAQDIFFMEQTTQEARNAYLEQLPSRISKEFMEQTPILQYLSDEGIHSFVPEQWEGIRMKPVRLKFKEELPDDIKPYNVKIPQNLQAPFTKEMERMKGYFYRESDSPIASPIVVAAKNTPPYIRLCGDYRKINKFLEVPKFPVPNVLDELKKIIGFKIFIDLDLANAFHQVPIDSYSSRILSIQSPIGHYEPKFMPEGISPASLILMKTMLQIFHDYLDWLIVIHDNVLLLALNYQDAFEKLKILLKRCKKVNLYLKLSKSNFGVTSVEFFGYVCTAGSYRLSDKRIAEVTAIPFPENTKQIQRFLGASVYFKPFILNYSHKTSALNDMTHKNFNWDKSTWSINYNKIFEDFKLDIINSYTLYYPDYNLNWYLMVDASDFAVGGVLIQKTIDGTQQIIAFVSKKLGKTARNWSTIEKEAFSMYFTVFQLRTYLNGKFFTLLTDHHNLLWIELSQVPKIIRIRLYLQSYNFNIIHINGKQNVFADYLSRMHPQDKDEQKDSILNVNDQLENGNDDDNVTKTLKMVHNSRLGHQGIRRTWLLLNKYFPGHKISQKSIADFISSCIYCQKYRFGMIDSLKPPIRVLNVTHRHTVGYDLLYISPEDSENYKYLHVIKMFPSRIVGLYPSKDLSAESLATALFQYFLTYGISDVLITDPGSNINSEVVKLLLSWFGIRLKISLTNRHQSNGVERTHREVIKFLSILVNDERIIKIWSKPQVIGTIQFILNSEVSSETNVSPFDYLFGSIDAKFFTLPDITTNIDTSNKFLNELNSNIKMIRDVANEIQQKIQENRLKENTGRDSILEELNTYKIGDYVFVNNKTMNMKKFKLNANFNGPYLIRNIHKADITIEHIVTKEKKIVHMEHLKPAFFQNYEEAYRAALPDYDQYGIKTIITYKGDPKKRTTIEMYVEFRDGDKRWIKYSRDISSTIQFEDFCKKESTLISLLYTEAEWKEKTKLMNSQPIKNVKPNDVCFVDLRSWGWDYYENLKLPNYLTTKYLVKCIYGTYSNKNNSRIILECKLFNQTFLWRNSDIQLYGSITELSNEMVEVTKEFCNEFPLVLK